MSHVSGLMSLNSEERSVLRLLAGFPDVVTEAADNLSPSTLCTYLYKLAASYNLFYAKHTILGEGIENRVHKLSSKLQTLSPHFRLSLTSATAQVLKNGLYLLGIETLEQM